MHRERGRRGLALIWTVLTLLLMIAVSGLTIDLSYLYFTGAQLQDAADAASLAGAAAVTRDPAAARSQSLRIAAANYAAGASVSIRSNPDNAPDGDVVIGRFDRQAGTFTATLVNPNAVKVVARRTAASPGGGVGLMFGPAFGAKTANIERQAIAMTSATVGGDAGIIVLNPNSCSALSLTGNANVSVPGGDIQVNSDSLHALAANGNGVLDAANVNVVGDYRFTSNANVTGELNVGAAFMPDPLAELPAPPAGADLGSVKLTSNQSRTLSPGYYSGGISAQGNSALTLRPGIYVLDGQGIKLSGNATLSAQGVMLYIKGSGSVSLAGNGSVTITPPDPTEHTFTGADVYQGIALFQGRSNSRDADIVGNGSMLIEGVIYFPKATLSASGNGDTLGSTIIADKLTLNGNGTIRVAYDDGPGPPKPQKVFLVK